MCSRLLPQCLRLVPGGLWLPREEEHEIVHGHGDPLFPWGANAVPLVDYDSHRGLIVGRLHMGFADPLGQARATGVLAFDDDALAMCSDVGEVAQVFSPRFYPAVDVFADVVAQMVGDFAFKP